MRLLTNSYAKETEQNRARTVTICVNKINSDTQLRRVEDIPYSHFCSIQPTRDCKRKYAPTLAHAQLPARTHADTYGVEFQFEHSMSVQNSIRTFDHI